MPTTAAWPFYLSEPDDPVVKTYAKAFPGLFQPLSAMPADLRPHIRYPQGLFTIQARMYATYHMQDPQVFYNKEDLWSIPKQGRRRAGARRWSRTTPSCGFPGEKGEEFILLTPFNPSKKDNMIAWMAARSDGPHYGKLIAYIFPKQKLIYGPRQIEARIDQDPFISQQLTLWSQRGSQVIRGSMLAIPIEKSLLYVQPLYLAAEKGSLPELKRVIVSMGNQIAMEESLEASLAQLFGTGGKALDADGDAEPGRPTAAPGDRRPRVGGSGVAAVQSSAGVAPAGEFRRLRRGDQAAGRNPEDSAGTRQVDQGGIERAGVAAAAEPAPTPCVPGPLLVFVHGGADPLRPVRPDLLLPNRHDFLQALDRVGAGLQRLPPVGRGDGDSHAGFADGQPTDAMHHRDPVHGPASLNLLPDLPHLGHRHLRIRVVLEVVYPAAPGILSHDTEEAGDCARGVLPYRLGHHIQRQWGFGDLK